MQPTVDISPAPFEPIFLLGAGATLVQLAYFVAVLLLLVGIYRQLKKIRKRLDERPQEKDPMDK